VSRRMVRSYLGMTNVEEDVIFFLGVRVRDYCTLSRSLVGFFRWLGDAGARGKRGKRTNKYDQVMMHVMIHVILLLKVR